MRTWTWLVLIASWVVFGCGSDGAVAPTDASGTGGHVGIGSGGLGGHSGGAGGKGAAGDNAGVSTGGKGGAVAGTGGKSVAGSGGAPSDAGVGDAAIVDGGQSGGVMRLSITQKAVPSEGEDHICVTLPLGNQRTVWVKSIHATLTTGSHHLIVDRHPVGSATQLEPASCSPTMGGDSTRLIIAQQRDTVLEMPEGTALRIDPQQPIFLQLHYINLAEAPADIEGAVELELADDAQGTPIEVQSVFNGSLSIDLPKHEAGSSEYFLNPGGTPQRPLHVFALTSHTHSLGIEATIERVASVAAPDSTPIHQSLNWHEPPLTTFDPTLSFDGSDGLRLRCKYMNDTDVDVHFGTRFEDEMCFMWLYYYEDP